MTVDPNTISDDVADASTTADFEFAFGEPATRRELGIARQASKVGIAAALDALDGSTRSAVQFLTGATDDELDEMGGFTNENTAIERSTAQYRRLSDVTRIIDHVLDTHEGVIGTHHEGCYLYHAGCLAVVLREALVWDFRDTGDVSGNDDEPQRTPQPCAVCGTNGGFSPWHRENRCVNHLQREE